MLYELVSSTVYADVNVSSLTAKMDDSALTGWNGEVLRKSVVVLMTNAVAVVDAADVCSRRKLSATTTVGSNVQRKPVGAVVGAENCRAAAGGCAVAAVACGRSEAGAGALGGT